MVSQPDLVEYAARVAYVFSSSVVRGRFDAVQQVMWRSRPFIDAWFRGANLKLTVHSDGIAVDDFAGKLFSKRQRQRSLSTARWTNHYNQ
jgi:hypothetical protein